MPQVDNSKDTISSSLTIKHAFGSTSSTIDSIQLYPYLVNEKVKHKLVYLSGKNICIQDTQCNSQEFMSGRLKRVKNVIKYIISSNNRFLVACESFRMDKEDIEDKKAVISIYNLITMTRVKTLFHKSDSEFIGCTFCADSKFIAGVTGEPNKEIVIWDWEKEKVIKIIPLESMDVNCIRSPPVPSTMLTISGNGTLKSITLSKDKVVKMDNLLVPSKESATFLNHIWLPFSSVLEHIMVCLTDINDFQTYLSRSRSQSQLQFQSNSQSLSQDSNALQNLGSKRQLVYIFAGNQTDNIVVLEIIQVITVKGNSNQQGFSDSSGPKVENIIATDKGFVLIGNTGFIAIYEHTLEEKDPFTEVRRLCLGDVTLISGVFIREEERMILLTKSNRLIKVTLFAPDQESDSKIKNVQEMKKQTFRRFSMQVTNDDMFSQREQLSSHADDLMFGGNHIMPIRAADSATDRPIVITIGADHTARIWDYENKKCDLVYSFRNDEPVAVAVHPLGFQTLIAFKDFIRLYNILIDELSPLKELQCKRCHDVKYSNSGHLFAAASHVTIFVYDSISFQILTTLNGHIMPIKSLNWTPGDVALISAGIEGNVYCWPVAIQGRIDVMVSGNRAVSVYGVTADCPNLLFRKPKEKTVGSQGGGRGVLNILQRKASSANMKEPEEVESYSIIVSTGDGYIRAPAWNLEMVESTSSALLSSTITIPPDDGRLHMNVLKLSYDRQYLFAGTNYGSLRIYSWPPIVDSTYPNGFFIELPLHEGKIVSIHESPTSNLIITTGEDSCVFMIDFERNLFPQLETQDLTISHNRKGLKKDLIHGDFDLKNIINKSVVMMTLDDVRNHIRDVADLKQAIQESQSKLYFETHKLSVSHTEDMKKLLDEFDRKMIEEKGRYQELKLDMEKKNNALIRRLEIEKSQHTKLRTEIENRYEYALEDQLERYDTVSERMERLRLEYEDKIREEKFEFERKLNAQRIAFALTEKRLQNETRRITQDRIADEVLYKDTIKRKEEEFEMKLTSIAQTYQSEIDSEQETINKLRNGVKSKNMKLEQMKLRMLDMQIIGKRKEAALEAEQQEKKVLMEAIETFKKKIQEGEKQITEQEKIIQELKGNNHTLESFKSVLNYDLERLMEERQPLSDHINDLKEHISDIYEELLLEFQLKKSEKIVKENQEKRVQDLTSQVNRYKMELKKNEQLTQILLRDISNLASTVVTPKVLEEGVKRMYRKYIKNEKLEERTANHNNESLVTSVQRLVVEGSQESMDQTKDIRKDDVLSASRKSTNLLSIVGRDLNQELVTMAAEAERQKQHLESIVEKLNVKLTRQEKDSEVLIKRKIHENSELLMQCKELKIRIKSLEDQLSQAHADIYEIKRAEEFRKEKKRLQESIKKETVQNTDEVQTSIRFNDSIITSITYPDFDKRNVKSGKKDIKKDNTLQSLPIRQRDAIIQNLTTRLNAYEIQLDEANREREMQRREIARIRKLLIHPSYEKMLQLGSIQSDDRLLQSNSSDSQFPIRVSVENNKNSKLSDCINTIPNNLSENVNVNNSSSKIPQHSLHPDKKI